MSWPHGVNCLVLNKGVICFLGDAVKAKGMRKGKGEDRGNRRLAGAVPVGIRFRIQAAGFEFVTVDAHRRFVVLRAHHPAYRDEP